MTKDYSKSKIYKIINDIDDYVYIGSTTERLSSRMAKHRFDIKRHNGRIYQHMRKYGTKYFHIVLIRNYPCTNKEELVKEERKEFELYNKNVLLNIHRPCTTLVEKRQDNIIRCKTYRQNNELQLKIYRHKYYQFNKLMQELPFYGVPLTTFFKLFNVF